MKKRTKYLILIITFSLLTLFDQFSKILAVKNLKKGSIPLIDGVFELFYLENRGAAWGILSGKISFFTIITVVILICIIFLIIKIEKYDDKKYTVLQILFTILAAGALGNLIDRVSKGYVVDFLYFKLIDFPVFNVADCYVTISVIALLFMMLFKFSEDELNNIFSLKKKRKV
ncbi:MAG: signal peptidase II [Lachnospiraceae bacterium]|nr:signal peptidase II [Lachnospiraceae bacterium]